MFYPELLQKLINYFKKFPTVGEKSAERMALATLGLKEEEIQDFAKVLVDCKKNLKKCSICGHLTENDICDICADEKRNHNLICVIEDYKSV